MHIKYSKQFLNKLENFFTETDYTLRYENGNFQSGYCILNDTKIALVNKFYTTEGKINCLIDILKSIKLDKSKLSHKTLSFFNELTQTELKF